PRGSAPAASGSDVAAGGGVLGTPVWSADDSGASGSGVASRASSLLFGGTVLTVSSTVGDGFTVATQPPRRWWGAPVFRQDVAAVPAGRRCRSAPEPDATTALPQKRRCHLHRCGVSGVHPQVVAAGKPGRPVLHVD